MDFNFSPAQERLRQEVREFLNTELGEAHISAGIHYPSKEFSRKVAKRGWIGMTWPKEYRGAGASYLDRLVVAEEMCRFGAPLGYHVMMDGQSGPALIRFGSEQLKREFLPKIIEAEITFTALLSEPSAGSDLAALGCVAVEDGDEFVISGQKIWSSYAHTADYGWLVAITDPAAGRYKNVSEFIVDLRRPGVTIRPIINLAGEHHFNEVFFDNYRLPSRYLVGKKNEGFRQIITQVDFERSGIERLMANYTLFGALVRWVRVSCRRGSRCNAALLRDRLADLKVQFEAGRLLIYRVAWLLSQGKVPNIESAMAKAYGTEFQQRLANVAVDVLGMCGLLRSESKAAPLGGLASLSYVISLCYTIQGGTSEVLRNVVGQRGLGLPAN